MTIPQDSAGLAAKILLARALENGTFADQYGELRDRSRREASLASQAFSEEVVRQLDVLADEIVGATGAVILYDEMATLAAGRTDLAADLQALAVVTGNIDRPGAGVEEAARRVEREVVGILEPERQERERGRKRERPRRADGEGRHRGAAGHSRRGSAAKRQRPAAARRSRRATVTRRVVRRAPLEPARRPAFGP